METKSYLNKYIKQSKDQFGKSNEKKEIKVKEDNQNFLKISPLKTKKSDHSAYKKENKDTSRNNNEIEERLKFIFTTYCQYGDKINFDNLKFTQFNKLCLDSEIIDRNINTEQLNVIYSNIKSKVNTCKFEDFLQLLKILSIKKYQIIYPNMSLADYLKILMNQNIIPLFEKISNDESNDKTISTIITKNNITKTALNISTNEINSFFNNESRDSLINIICNSSASLYEIYKVYFNEDSNFNFYDNKTTLINKSKNSFIQLLNDFDICPLLINKNTAYSIFNSIVYELKNNPFEENMLDILKDLKIFKEASNSNNFKTFMEETYNFSFISFYLCLFKIAHIAFIGLLNKKFDNLIIKKNTINSTIPDLNFNFESKITFLIEKMENSDGINIVRSKCSNTTSNISNTKIFSSDHMEITDNIISSLYDYNDTKEIRSHTDNKNVRLSMINKELNYEFTSYILTNYTKDLEGIFSYYCSFGENQNSKYMKLTKFHKLLRDCNLISSNDYKESKVQDNKETINSNKRKTNVKQDYWIVDSDVDLIFYKILKDKNSSTPIKKPNIHRSLNNTVETILTNDTNYYQASNKNKRRSSLANCSKVFEYDDFIKSLECICKLLFPDYNFISSFECLFDNNFKLLSNIAISKKNNTFFEYLKEKSNNIEYSDILSRLEYSVDFLFNFYSKEDNEVCFDSLLQFSKDFNLFPEVITKFKLKSHFSYITKNEENSNKLQQEKIKLMDFVDILALISLEFKIKSIDNPKFKLLFLIDYMIQSEGIERLVSRTNKMCELKQSEKSIIFHSFLNNYPEYIDFIKNHDKNELMEAVRKNDFYEMLID